MPTSSCSSPSGAKPARDIDTTVADSLNVLDLKPPNREADMDQHARDAAEGQEATF